MSTYRKSVYITLLLAFLLFSFSFVIRIYKVDTAPSGILIDEASHGYNAFSILKTGKDEHGVSYPLVFKAFGDQKLPLYTYLIVPAIKLFGLSVFAIRLPSVLAGSLFPIAIFFLLLEFGFRKKISLLGGLIAATNPWTIILSRFGYESNLGLLLFSLGILFSLMAVRRQRIYISLLAGIFFGLSLYSYIAYRFITPLILLSIIILHFKKNAFTAKIKLILIFSFIVTIAPLVLTLLSPQSSARFNQAGYGYSSGLKMEIDENRTFCSQRLPRILCYSASNKVLFMARSYLYRYIEAFSPGYLFLTGDSKDPSLNVDNFGLFYVWLLPFYLLGILVILNRLYHKHFLASDIFIFLGCIISVTPSLLVDRAHILRLTALFPFLIIVMMYGVLLLENYFKSRIARQITFASLYILSLLSVFFFLILFLTVHVQKYEIAFRTFVPKLMNYLGVQDPHTQIYINSLTEGIMYYSFINRVDPSFYQKNVKWNKPDVIGFFHASDLSNVHITNESLIVMECRLKESKDTILYVSNENLKTIPDNAKLIIYSDNKVDTLAIIYDLNKINFDELTCNLNQ